MLIDIKKEANFYRRRVRYLEKKSRRIAKMPTNRRELKKVRGFLVKNRTWLCLEGYKKKILNAKYAR